MTLWALRSAQRTLRQIIMSIVKLPITALVPMRNEEANIADCLESLQFCDEILVVDSHSSDRSPEMAAALGAQIVQFNYQPGGPKKKNWALDNLPFRHDW